MGNGAVTYTYTLFSACHIDADETQEGYSNNSGTQELILGEISCFIGEAVSNNGAA